MGTPAACMDLDLFSASDKFLQKLDNNEALLGSYHVDDDCRIHVGINSFLTHTPSTQKTSDITKLGCVDMIKASELWCSVHFETVLLALMKM